MSDRFEIRKEVVLPATPEQVWHAVATREGQRAWSPDPDAVEAPGTQVERQEGERLYVRTPEGPDGAFHAFEYLVEGRDDSTTVLTFVHSGFLGEDWGGEYDFETMTGYGWDLYMVNLTQYLTHFADRQGVFVTGQGPQSETSAESWAPVAAALGVTGPLAVGDRVTLTPAGFDPIEGVVDWVVPTDDFVGVRANDGLYRFHNNTVMGMPVAFGHYLFADVDAAAESARWESWLAGVYR
ncbi:SRPBCC family protein [Georgenia sp. Z1344]|uniref:SRPBCC family protein n=1 Tax=Georgenia sp. Z1344 TaxID=3416706 RepID=UPI003CE7546C